MPRYEFGCACGKAILQAFAMREVPAGVPCGVCGGEARRVFTAPQVNRGTLSSEANKRGLAELDASRRTDERVYARNWNCRLPNL
jgi:hypothetical protein